MGIDFSGARDSLPTLGGDVYQLMEELLDRGEIKPYESNALPVRPCFSIPEFHFYLSHFGDDDVVAIDYNGWFSFVGCWMKRKYEAIIQKLCPGGQILINGTQFFVSREFQFPKSHERFGGELRHSSEWRECLTSLIHLSKSETL